MTDRRTSTRRLWWPLLVTLPLALAGPLLAGCGGAGSASAASEGSRERQEEVRNADFARCLREHGIQAETAHGPGGGFGLKVHGKAGQGAGPQQMEAAQSACKQYQPKGEKVNLSPQQKVEREEAVRKFASCMRAHGIDVHASTSGGGVQIAIGGPSGGGPNPESPKFQAAQKACQGLLPFRKRDGPGAPSGPGAAAPDTSGG
jgi:hypothetical protein